VNEERFRTMVGDQRPALTRFALALTAGDRDAAEDLVQEAMVRAWRSDHLPTARPTPVAGCGSLSRRAEFYVRRKGQFIRLPRA